MMRSDGSGEPVVRLLFRVSEAALALGLSRAKVYELINSGGFGRCGSTGHDGLGRLTWKRS